MLKLLIQSLGPWECCFLQLLLLHLLLCTQAERELPTRDGDYVSVIFQYSQSYVANVQAEVVESLSCIPM